MLEQLSPLQIRRRSIGSIPVLDMSFVRDRRKIGTMVLTPATASPADIEVPSWDLSLLSTPDFLQHFALEDQLGSGTTATVRRAVRSSDGRKFAVKCLASAEDEVRQFLRDEYELLRTLQHESIIQVESLYESPCQMWMCMELCGDGSMEQYIHQHGAYTEAGARNLFLKLLLGVDYLHSKRVVHRDLKPANLLLQQNCNILKIADFNSAKQIGNAPGSSLMLTDRGTHLFGAPELHLGQDWNELVDVWACGLCLYYMLWAELPFQISDPSVKRTLSNGMLPAIEFGGISTLMKNMTLQCLSVNMHDRPPAMLLLMHPVFSQNKNENFSETTQKPLPGSGCSLGARLDSAAEELPSSSWLERRDGSDALARLSNRVWKRIEEQETVLQTAPPSKFQEAVLGPAPSLEMKSQDGHYNGHTAFTVASSGKPMYPIRRKAKQKQRGQKPTKMFLTMPDSDMNCDAYHRAVKMSKFFTTHGAMHVFDAIHAHQGKS